MGAKNTKIIYLDDVHQKKCSKCKKYMNITEFIKPKHAKCRKCKPLGTFYN